MTTIEFTTSEILLANCCVLCVARIILYCTTLSWRGSSVNLCKIATPHPLTTVWRQTSEIHTFYFFMQLCTVTAQFSLKWQIVRHPKCCVQQRTRPVFSSSGSVTRPVFSSMWLSAKDWPAPWSKSVASQHLPSLLMSQWLGLVNYMITVTSFRMI